MLSLAVALAVLTADLPHYIVPVCAEPGTGFGYRVDPFTERPAFHAGLDFAVAVGTPVFASASGKVVSAETRGHYGLMVEIDHGRTNKTRYGHLSEIAVAAGQEVAQGTIIAKSGATGRTTGPILHFEIWQTRVLDPRKHMGENPHCKAE